MAQIDTLTEVNKAIEAQKKLLLDVSKVMKNQLDLAIQLKAAVMGGGDVAKTAESYKNLTGILDGASKAAEEHEKKINSLGGISEKTRKQILGLAEGSDKAGKSLGIMSVAAAGVQGAFKGLEFTTNVMSGLGGLIGTVGSAMWDLAKTVIAFPFALWDGLFSKAAGLAANTEWRQALENIRKEFGNLATGSSKAMIDMTKSMRGALDETGLRVRRIFGNRAEILTWITGVAKSMGNMFQLLRDKGQLADKDVERFGALYKGLGVSEEGMKAVAREALLAGKTVVAQMTDMANYAIQMGKAYGINAKEISKDMQGMMLDLKHFGGLSKKAMSEASIYARKLGMDIKDLAGLLDTFDTLDAGMEASAKLNQALGLNLNGLELMNAAAKGGPAEVAEAVRKSMKEQGFSIATLNRQQQNMMASTLGLTNEQLQLIDVQNKGASLDDIKKKGAAAQKAQLSQAEATQQLASSIERLVKTMEPLQKGLFAAFFDGFQKGVFRSYEFRKVLLEIRQVLWIVTRAGRELGFAFVQMFPGVKDIFKGMQDFFDPQRWRKMMRSVIDAFKAFFKDIQNNPEAGLKNLFLRLKDVFFKHFDASNPAGMKVIDGFKTFFTSILKAVIGGAKAMIPVVMSALTDLIKGITSFLKNGIPDAVTKGAGGLGEQFLSVLSDLWGVIKKSWPALKVAIVELLTYLKNTVWNWAMEHKMLIAGVLGAMMLPSIIGAVINSGMAIMGGLLVKGLLGTAKSVAGNATLKKGISNLFGGGPAAGLNQVAGTPPIMKPPPGNPPSIGRTMMWAAFIAVAMAALVFAVVTLADNLKTWAPNLTAGTLAMSIAAMLGAGLILAEIAGIAIIIQAGSSAASKALSGLLPFGLFVAGVTGIMVGMIWLIGQINVAPAKMVAGAAALGIMAIVLAAMLPLAGVAIAFSLLMSSGPVALIGSAMILGGLAAMGTMAIAVIDTAKKVIAAASTINLSNGIESKVQLVLSIINSLGGFARSIASILKAMPRVHEGDTRGFQTALTSVSRFIDSIKDKVISFVNSIKEIATKIPESELSKISAVVGIIRSLTTTISSVGQVLQAANSGTILRQSTAYTNISNTMSNFFSQSGPMANLVQVVGLVINLFKGKDLLNVNPGNLKAISEASMTIITGLSNVIVSLSKASGTVVDTAAATKFIRDTTNALFGGGANNSIITMITNLLSSFSKAAAGIDASQLPKIQAFTELIGGLLTGMSSIIGVFAPITSMKDPTVGPQQIRLLLDILVESISSVVDNIGRFLPNMIKGILKATDGINVGTLKKKVSILSTVVQFMGDLSGMLNSLSWTAKNADGVNKTASTGLVNLYNMISGSGGHGDIFTVINALTSKMSTLQTPDEASKNVMTQISKYLGGDTKGGGHGLIGMVDKVNQLNRAFSGMNVANINAKLQSIGTILGVKGSELAIKSEAFNLTVNFNIKLDATTIENVIAERAVNHGTGQVGKRSPFIPGIVQSDESTAFRNGE